MIQRFGTKCCGQMKSDALASTVFGGKEILSMTQRTTSPPSSMEVEPLCSGAVFLLRGQDGFTVPCTVKYENFQNSKNSEAMGLQHDDDKSQSGKTICGGAKALRCWAAAHKPKGFSFCRDKWTKTCLHMCKNVVIAENGSDNRFNSLLLQLFLLTAINEADTRACAVCAVANYRFICCCCYKWIKEWLHPLTIASSSESGCCLKKMGSCSVNGNKNNS